MSITENELKISAQFNETLAMFGAIAVIFGVALEVVFAAFFDEPPKTFLSHWGPVCADAIVAVGVAAEVFFGRRSRTVSEELTRMSDARLAEATKAAGEAYERASLADLKRAELEAKLQPRMTDERQFGLIQELRGKVGEVSIIHDSSAEPRWFATSLRDAFWQAGIRCAVYRLSPDNPTEGIFIYDPCMRGAKVSGLANALVDVFRETDISVAILSGPPTETAGAPLNFPTIIIGERLAVLPPHIVKANKSAHAAYLQMKEAGLTGDKEDRGKI